MARFLFRFCRDKLAVTGSLIVLGLIFISLAAPYISPCSPSELNLLERLSPPSMAHPMGTDPLGRDVLSRVIYGTRLSLMTGLIVISLEMLIGLFVGTAAGYMGKIVDDILMRGTDIVLAFPGIILSMVIAGTLGSSIFNLIVALSAVGWTKYARVVRGAILSIKKETFVMSAKAAGCSHLRIAFRHILPNIISPVIVLATLNMGTTIISIAGLSFLGLGVQPPASEWGIMLNDGRPFMESAPYLMIFPGLMIMITVLAFNFIGDGLRDILEG